MAEFPALPLWTDAYLADTKHLSTIQHGAFLLLLFEAWRSKDCSLPDDDKFLAKITGMTTQQWTRNKPVLMQKWNFENGRWWNGRLRDELNSVRRQRDQKKHAGQASALKRLNRSSTAVQQPFNGCSTPTPTPITRLSLPSGFERQNPPGERAARDARDEEGTLSQEEGGNKTTQEKNKEGTRTKEGTRGWEQGRKIEQNWLSEAEQKIIELHLPIVAVVEAEKFQIFFSARPQIVCSDEQWRAKWLVWCLNAKGHDEPRGNGHDRRSLYERLGISDDGSIGESASEESPGRSGGGLSAKPPDE